MKMQMTYDTRAAHIAPQTYHPLRAMLETLAVWGHRRAERRNLRQIDDHLLRDIGLDRVQVEAMATRPFWRA